MSIQATNQTFQSEVLESSIPVLVDFYADWCAPCKALAPSFEAAATEYQGKVKFVKVNIDDTDIAQKYGVRGIPTLIAFKDGQVQATKTGSISKSVLSQLVAAQV